MKIPGSALCIVRKISSGDLSYSFRGIPVGDTPVAVADQVHGSHVAVARNGGVYTQTDGLVTTDRSILLAIRVADCVPIIVRSQAGRMRGVIHAGRAGIAAGIVEAAMAACNGLLKSDDPVSVWLGPHIGPCCYRFSTGQPMSREIRRLFPDGYRTSGETVTLDLAREIRARFERMGIDSRKISVDSRCTACSPGTLPSHRREGCSRTRSLLIFSFHGIQERENNPMAVDPELLKILACPETKEPVFLASESLIDRLNQLIEEGTVKNRGGEPVTDAIDAGLVREDQRFLYPIRDDIPIMLIEEAIELPALNISASS